MMAEDSSDRTMITHPIHEGGLGFNFKWDLGWMHDRLDYMEQDFQWQQFAQTRLLYGNQFTEPGKQLLFMGQEVRHVP